ncbi:MAG: FHA domain-containing protein [Deltaproteobacteria bacterium]|nr:FHA domain-containing protein [Deltaproteobacteria bacterium]
MHPLEKSIHRFRTHIKPDGKKKGIRNHLLEDPMPVLTIETDTGAVKVFDLKSGDALSIGRQEDNDIVIPDTSVSRRHAGIESEGDAFFLTDYQSRNGSFVNGQLVIFRKLAHGDVITIGNQSMTFSYREDEKRPEEEPEEMFDMTMAMDTRDHRSLVARGVAGLVSDDEAEGFVGVLTFISGGSGELVLEKDTIRIGKSEDADVVIRGMLVGKTAAVIQKTGDGYEIRPGEGLAKPKVNFAPLKETLRLEEFDVIDIGSVKLQFQYRQR